MQLRAHQVDMINIVDGIIKGSTVKNIICKITTGAGKSIIPIIAGRLITAGLADAICWICPRMSLQNQAERNYIDPFFRKLLAHKLVIRASTNDNNPCRGTNGFVTTYPEVTASIIRFALQTPEVMDLLSDLFHADIKRRLDEKNKGNNSK